MTYLAFDMDGTLFDCSGIVADAWSSATARPGGSDHEYPDEGGFARSGGGDGGRAGARGGERRPGAKPAEPTQADLEKAIRAITEALAGLGPAALPALQCLARDPSWEIRREAAHALDRLQPGSLDAGPA